MRTKRAGRPEKPGADIATRVPGMPRFSIEISEAMLRDIDREAMANDRSRVAEVRVLIAEALASRARSK